MPISAAPLHCAKCCRYPACHTSPALVQTWEKGDMRPVPVKRRDLQHALAKRRGIELLPLARRFRLLRRPKAKGAQRGGTADTRILAPSAGSVRPAQRCHARLPARPAGLLLRLAILPTACHGTGPARAFMQILPDGAWHWSDRCESVSHG
jgi:hypothetical protein